MNQSWTIAKKELTSYFDSLVAYILIVIFLAFTGFFTWMSGNGDIFFRKQADLNVFFQMSLWALFIFIPAITMRMIAEEKKSGTIELLLTKNVSNLNLVIGKFLAALLLVIITFGFTIIYYISVSRLGNFDHGATISGYLGLILLSAAFIGIGLFASSLTHNQIVAFLLAMIMNVLFMFLFDILGSTSTGWLGDLFTTLSLNEHYESISRGVIDSKDVIYFLSLAFLGIVLSEYMISKRS